MTEANTNANSRTQVKCLTELNKKVDMSVVLLNGSCLDNSSFPMDCENTKLDNRVVAKTISNNETSIKIDHLYLDQDVEMTEDYEESKLLSTEDTSYQNMSIDSPPMSSVQIAKTPKQNITYEAIDQTNSCKSHINTPDVEEESKIIINQTVTIQGLANQSLTKCQTMNKTYDLSLHVENLNQTFEIVKKDKNSTQLIDKEILGQNSFLNLSNITFEENTKNLNETLEKLQHSLLVAGVNAEPINQSQQNKSNVSVMLNETVDRLHQTLVANCVNLEELDQEENKQAQLEDLKERMLNSLSKMKMLKTKVLEYNKAKKEENERLKSKKEKKEYENSDLKEKIKSFKEQISKAKLQAASDPNLAKALDLDKQKCDKIQNGNFLIS